MNLSAISLAINRPSQAGLPALNLDFAGTRSVDSRITFTRASTATRFNSSGVLETVAVNTPRIDFDPVTGACLGLLIEMQRTNLVVRSQEFDNASWSKHGATVTANAIIAPDGTLSADTLVEDASTGVHETVQAATLVVSTQYALSVFAKAGSRAQVRVAGSGGGSWSLFPQGVFDLLSGTVLSSSGDRSATIQSVGNGWYRCTVYGTATNTNAGITVGVANMGTSSYTGDGTSGIFIWGAQLEAGAFATSYIPTTSSQVTRSVDTAVMTGTNFSSWYRQDEGTLFAEASSTDFSATSGVIAVGDPTLAFGSAETMYFGFTSGNSGRPTLRILDAGVAQVGSGLTVAGTVAENTPIKMAAAYKLNDFAFTFSGAPPATDTSGTVPTPTGCSIGGYSQGWTGGGARLNGHIRRIAYWPTRLPNNQLQALTA